MATLALRPGAAPQITSELHDAETGPVREARRLCLLDHLHELRDLLADTSGAEEVSID